MIKTKYGTEFSRKTAKSRVDELINQFYKILPMKENDTPTLPQYIGGLLRELLGMKELVEEWHEDGRIITLCGILQYMLDNPDCETAVVRSDVFKAINMIRLLQCKYSAD